MFVLAFLFLSVTYYTLWSSVSTKNFVTKCSRFKLNRDRLINKPIAVNVKANILYKYQVLCIILTCIVCRVVFCFVSITCCSNKALFKKC